MRAASYLRQAARESRGSAARLAFFVACLAVGVAAVVSVAGLSASVRSGIRAEARQLLGGDVAVEGHQPPPPELLRAIAAIPGARHAEMDLLVTMAAAPGPPGRPGRSQIVQLKAVGEGYPFYGGLRLAPDLSLARLLDPGSTVVAPELLARLGLRVGDRLLVGGVPFRITGEVLSEPDRLGGGFALGPRVFVSAEGLRRTRLLTFGSRIGYRVLVRLPGNAGPADTAAAAARLKRALPQAAYYEVETYDAARPELRDSLSRGERFLGLVALLSLLVGGIGVAQTVRAWLASRIDSIAVLKCLGMRPREILALYLGQTALLGLAGSLVGALLAVGVLAVVPRLLGGLVPLGLVHVWQPFPMLRGTALGVGVAVVFSLPPLAGLLEVPPSLVLRRDAEPLRGSRLARTAASVALLAGVWVTAVVQSGSALWGGLFTAGLAAAAGVLSLAAIALSRAAGRAPRRLARFWLRFGLSALARPGAGTIGAIVALGLGVLVVLAMALVEDRLHAQLSTELPTSAPSAFLMDIQPDEWPGIERILTSEGASEIQSVPIVNARIRAVDGRTVEQIEKEARSGRPREHEHRWALTREQNLAILPRLPAGNTLLAGSVWAESAAGQVSVEQEFAREIGAHLGSSITLDVQGVAVSLTVTSLRKVEWRTFGPNFFLVVEPGVLDRAPQFRLAAARLPAGKEQAGQDRLAAGFPNVTLFNVREVLEKIVSVLDRVGLGVRILGLFTVLAGVAILAGAVSAGSVRRGREVALLKTIGMTRSQVVAVLSVEYALVGLVAGLIGAAGGGVLAWVVLSKGMEIAWAPRPAAFAVAIGGSMALSVAAGIAASARALSRRPIEVLRSE